MTRKQVSVGGGRLGTAVLGLICGAQLAVAGAVGGAGLGAFFGLEGAFVAAIAALLIASLLSHRRPRIDTRE